LHSGLLPRGGHQFGDGGVLECPLDHGDRLIEPAVQRAEVDAVTLNVQRASFYPPNRVYRLDHVVDGDLLCRPREHRTAVEPAPRPNESGHGQAAQHLGQIPFGRAGGRGDLRNRRRLVVEAGQVDDEAQRVFGGL